MILVRSPLRISIIGGSTDLPSFYRKYSGFVISGAINKYVYVLVNRTMQEEILLKYSQFENPETINDINHPIIREVLKRMQFKSPQLEIVTFADIPGGMGLGSSSSFTCALLKALYSHRNIQILPDKLAEKACSIEIDTLKGNLGKQDQYISAYGGLQCMWFDKDDEVAVRPLKISFDKMLELQDSIMLFFTGFTHTTNDVLKDQVKRTENNDEEMIANLLKVKEMAFEGKKLLESGDITGYGKLTHEHWMNKRKRSNGMSNDIIDQWYNAGINAGAIGGKLVGSGGGGFLMFITEDQKRLRNTMKEIGLEEVRFNFDFEGTKRII